MAHKAIVGGMEYKISGGRTYVDGKGYDILKGRTYVNGMGYDIPFSTTLNLTFLTDFVKRNTGVIVDGVTYNENGTYEISSSEPITLFFNGMNVGIKYANVYLNSDKEIFVRKTDFTQEGNLFYYDLNTTASVVNIQFGTGGDTALDIRIKTVD